MKRNVRSCVETFLVTMWFVVHPNRNATAKSFDF